MAFVERVILVDEYDREIGTAEKLDAHVRGGSLHRAFSIFLFNETGALLLQRRAASKYHFAGLWTNSCCGHPRPGELVLEAARRRLREELGIEANLSEAFVHTYQATDESTGLTEREFDHVLVGQFDGKVFPNPDEIDDHSWVTMEDVARNAMTTPADFTPWFREILARFMQNDA